MLLRIDNKNLAHLDMLKNFVSSLGQSGNTFRYFNSRDFAVLEKHLCTVLLVQNDMAIGYGHLDQEGSITWLGISIIEGYTGQGNGKKVMDYLMNFAVTQDLKEINLSVDDANIGAISLYKMYGFVEFSVRDHTSYFKKIRDENP